MQMINVYTAGLDPDPIEGTFISIIESRTTFGLFESNHAIVGAVQKISDIDRAEYGLDDALFEVGDQHYVTEGTKWMYQHEMLPIVTSIAFPFQDNDYYQVALKEGWCVEEMVTYSEPRFIEGVEISTKTCHTRFNGVKFSVKWIQHGSEEPIFHEWSECDE